MEVRAGGCLIVPGLAVSVCLFCYLSETTPVFQVFRLALGPVVSCVLAVFNFHIKNMTF